MTTFGKYRLLYDPPGGSLEPEIAMGISAEADLKDMLDFFKTFLMAAGYASVSPLDDLVLHRPEEGEYITPTPPLPVEQLVTVNYGSTLFTDFISDGSSQSLVH